MPIAHLDTSSSFASAIAHGTDWRDVGRKLLEKLESIRTPDDGMVIGFLYGTYNLGEGFGSLLTLLRNVTHIQHWFGATGPGVCGAGRSYVDEPAAVAMIGRVSPASFRGFELKDGVTEFTPELQAWILKSLAGTAITHGILTHSTANRLGLMRERDGLFAVGGFSAGPAGGQHIASGATSQEEILSGVIFNADAPLMTGTSYGCLPAGKAGRITSCTGNTIIAIDGMPAFAFLKEAIAAIKTPEGEAAPRQGHLHAAFPIPGSDGGAVLIRNISNADEVTQHVSVAHPIQRGDSIQFVYRDREAALTDLTQTVRQLHKRGQTEFGAANYKPKAILYYGCGARMPMNTSDDEARIIRDVFGEVPMAGFYTAAEVCNGHVFGYTGVVVVFV